jgi:uncharacterized protein (DUF1800 family)
MFESPELLASSWQKIQGPQSVRRFIGKARVRRDRPIANALALGLLAQSAGSSRFFGRITPDGWPLDNESWSSSGQMEKRFDIAQRHRYRQQPAVHASQAARRAAPGFPMLTTRLYYEAIEPYLSQATHDALTKATSQQEWNTFLLSSPDLNYR